jgi:putative DNA primase/helicase
VTEGPDYAVTMPLVRKPGTAQRIAAMLDLASSETGVAIRGGQFDASPWLLNVLNGVLDVRTGELRPHDRKYLITKLCPVRYDATAKAPSGIALPAQQRE